MLWPPDWSQFVPDLIVSLLVGAGIGFAVFRLEARADDRRKRREAELNWGLVRPRVSAALTREYWETPVGYGNGPLITLTEIAGSFRKLAKRYPFAAWSGSAPGNMELLLVTETARSLFELDETAEFLDHALAQHYMLSDAHSEQETQISFSRHEIMGFGIEEGWSANAAFDYDVYFARHEEMLNEIGDAVERFLEARDAFSMAWTAARDTIRGNWGDKLRMDI